MREINDLLASYGINDTDIKNIRMAAPTLLNRTEKLLEIHYTSLLDKDETAFFFRDTKTMARAREAFSEWLSSLFSAEYDRAYLKKLARIGATHVRIKLPAHHVNIAMSNMRRAIAEIVRDECTESEEQAAQVLFSINKALDLNLDVMTRSYREAELSVNFLSHRLDNAALRMAKWFVNGFNMALVVGLVITGVMALGLSVYDFFHALSGEAVGHNVLRALGSLLILWVVIELLDTQIRHIRGGSALVIKVFISVALVAELRKLLITSVEHTAWQDQIIPNVSVLILGFIYWLVSRMKEE